VKATLLDLNILTALLWPAHEHHDAAHRWFAAGADASWATCALTQLGFVRIVSNPAFSRDALSPADATALLARNLGHQGHQFWSDDLELPAAISGIEGRLQGHRQVTDAYLLALAHRNKGVLATFDRGAGSFAGDRFAGAVVVVPTR
jgi:toxin-antitoxin system PIN domain toxin